MTSASRSEPALGVYKTGRGAVAELLRAGPQLIFRAQGRHPWESTVQFSHTTPSGEDVYLLPQHPLNKKVGRQGMLLVNSRSGAGLKECPGDPQKEPYAVWTFEGTAAPGYGYAATPGDAAANPIITAPDGYGAPPSGYDAPPPGYGAPASGYTCRVTCARPDCKLPPSGTSAFCSLACKDWDEKGESADIDWLRDEVLKVRSQAEEAASALEALKKSAWVTGQKVQYFSDGQLKWYPGSLMAIDAHGNVDVNVDGVGMKTVPASEVERRLKHPEDGDGPQESLKGLACLSKSELEAEWEKANILFYKLKDEISLLRAGPRHGSSFRLASSGRDMVPTSLQELDLLGSDSECGLTWNRQWEGLPFGPETEELRTKARYGTRDKVAHELGLKKWGDPAARAKNPPYAEDTRLLRDRSPESGEGQAPSGGTNLLGRYDCVFIRARADMDRDWNYISGGKPSFWVVHAAAVNVGESARAPDFPDFSKDGVLDCSAYADANGHICQNIVTGANGLGIEHLIFFPFGLGAFLRQLDRNDRRFRKELEMQNLRRTVVKKFADAMERTRKDMQIHLCICFAEGEPSENADAFLRAFASASPELKKRTTVWPSGDALQLAHDLASGGSRKVLLVNGANRQLLGNHWFGNHAKKAIDENLHRRSWTMAALSYMLNNYGGWRSTVHRVRKDTLKENVEWIGGKSFCVDGDRVWRADDEEWVCVVS